MAKAKAPVEETPVDEVVAEAPVEEAPVEETPVEESAPVVEVSVTSLPAGATIVDSVETAEQRDARLVKSNQPVRVTELPSGVKIEDF